MKCTRGTCRCRGRADHRGLCSKHYQHDLIVREARGELVRGIVDAGPTQAHIAILEQCGMSQMAIARAAGLTDNGLYLLMGRKRITKASADKILSVTPEMAYRPSEDGNELMPTLGTVRRIKSLMAIGYTLQFISRSVGREKFWASAVLNGNLTCVRADSVRAVSDLFDRLQSTPAPDSRVASRARNRAKTEGWPHPFAWDEGMIDDPNAEPCDMTAVDKDAWHEDYLELKEIGKSDEHIAGRLGITYEALRVRLRRHNATDSSHQEHQQVRESHEQVVCAYR